MIAGLDGELLTPGSATYEAVIAPHDPAFAGIRPACVLRCASESDVARGFELARTHGLPVVARGGGHDLAGRSCTTGLLLDLSPMSGIAWEDSTVIRVGAGDRLRGTYDALHRRGRTVPGGCGDTVGVVGLTLGGGWGLIGRRHGLTCDRLVAARVVLPDGRAIDCSAEHEPDLFWALRGGGGGGGWGS